MMLHSLEILPSIEILTELPVRRDDAVKFDHTVAAHRNLERQALPGKDIAGLPVLAPVPSHLDPARARTLDLNIDHVPRPTDVVHQDKYPVRVSLDLELDPSLLRAGCPPVLYWDDPGLWFCNLRKHGHREIEVFQRRVAPVIFGLGVVRRAEICRGHNDRRGIFDAPLRVVHALDLKAGPARQAIVEEGGAQGRRGQAIALLE